MLGNRYEHNSLERKTEIKIKYKIISNMNSLSLYLKKTKEIKSPNRTLSSKDQISRSYFLRILEDNFIGTYFTYKY